MSVRSFLYRCFSFAKIIPKYLIFFITIWNEAFSYLFGYLKYMKILFFCYIYSCYLTGRSEFKGLCNSVVSVCLACGFPEFEFSVHKTQEWWYISMIMALWEAESSEIQGQSLLHSEIEANLW